MKLSLTNSRKRKKPGSTNAPEFEGHIDLDRPGPPQNLTDDVDKGRRGFVGKGLLALGAAVASGVVGADIGARIREANDREVTFNAVKGLVEEAGRKTARREQDAATAAMAHAQQLTSGLLRSRGQSVVSGHVVDGTITWQTKDGPMKVYYPVALGDFDGSQGTEGTRWVATPAIDQGMVVFNILPVDDSAKVVLNGPESMMPVSFYTSGHGGNSAYETNALWATVDGQTAWRQPGELQLLK